MRNLRADVLHTSRPLLDPLLNSLRTSEAVSGFTHNFYRYPARFSPEFVRKAIAAFTKPNDIVFDPFMGGGTTVVEALALGRRCIGADINPLSVFITDTKTTPLSAKDGKELLQWATTVNKINLHDSNDPHLEWEAYQHNLPWWLRKTFEFALDSIETLRTERQQLFARASLIKTAQWALDCKRSIPTKTEFLARHSQDLNEMLSAGMQFRKSFRLAFGKLGSLTEKRRILAASAIGIDRYRYFPNNWEAPRLVLTSPPYMGVHILYHRWQVNGRRETPAPYWLAGCKDGNGGAYYTFGDRKRKDNMYFSHVYDCFSSIIEVLDKKSLIVQLVAFSNPNIQLPQYLETMNDVGLKEVKFSTKRNWRTVPNRKWYAFQRGALPSSKEILLFHKLS